MYKWLISLKYVLIIIKIKTPQGVLCAISTLFLALDTFSHHAASCKHGGDMVARHNHLRSFLFCRRAHLPVKGEVGYGLGIGHFNSCPADVLVLGWDR